MTKKDYDDLDDLFNDLESDLIDIMTDEVDKVVKKVYENQVDYMYDEYDRTYYEPRYKNDGFADEDNWRSEVTKKGDALEYTMKNTTMTNGDNVGRLDRYIEQGIYNWKRHPNKRPVYARSQEILDGTSHVDIALSEGLSKKGWK